MTGYVDGPLNTPDRLPAQRSDRTRDWKNRIFEALDERFERPGVSGCTNRTTAISLDERGDTVRMTIPDGFWDEMTAEVSTFEEALEYARSWIRELGINDEGDYAPKKGMHCTVSIGSDRYAARIERVSDSGKTIWIEGQQYSYRRHAWRSGRSYHASIGWADSYCDPHF